MQRRQRPRQHPQRLWSAAANQHPLKVVPHKSLGIPSDPHKASGRAGRGYREIGKAGAILATSLMADRLGIPTIRMKVRVDQRMEQHAGKPLLISRWTPAAVDHQHAKYVPAGKRPHNPTCFIEAETLQRFASLEEPDRKS